MAACRAPQPERKHQSRREIAGAPTGRPDRVPLGPEPFFIRAPMIGKVVLRTAERTVEALAPNHRARHRSPPPTPAATTAVALMVPLRAFRCVANWRRARRVRLTQVKPAAIPASGALRRAGPSARPDAERARA
ncbi:hypothetical protein GCM10009416_02610 [Craurococcus roseus]|uniref:Uncharacterized protein n=1 Tax=Craurococcus roseus TaxID=77585 RepID=A0ABP3PMP7_9PROT